MHVACQLVRVISSAAAKSLVAIALTVLMIFCGQDPFVNQWNDLQTIELHRCETERETRAWFARGVGMTRIHLESKR